MSDWLNGTFATLIWFQMWKITTVFSDSKSDISVNFSIVSFKQEMKRSLYSRETHKNGNINSLNKQKHAYNSIFWEYRCESGIVKNGVPLKIMPSVPLKYLKMVEIKPLLRSSCWTMQLLLSSFNPCSCWSTQQLWLPFTRNPSLKGSILPYTVQFTLYTVCCTLYTVHCMLHT